MNYQVLIAGYYRDSRNAFRKAWIMHNQQLGEAAERVVEKQLESEGYSILARNFRTRRAEIDLIARKEGCLLFVEVKGRSTFRPDEAWLPFWRKKKWKIYAAARVFLRLNPAISHHTDAFGLEIFYVTHGRVIERFEERGFF